MVPVLSAPMPEICIPQFWQAGGTANSLMPLLVPFNDWLIIRRPISPSKPSVHQILPEVSKVMRCGVEFILPGVKYSSILPVVSDCPDNGGVKRPIRETALLFSVNQSEPVAGSGPTMP